MRKYGVNKRNPNPPWPNEQSVVVVPSGVGASAVGRHGEKVRNMPTEETVPRVAQANGRMPVIDAGGMQMANMPLNTGSNTRQGVSGIPDVPEERETPIKSFIPETSMRNSDLVRNMPEGSMPFGNMGMSANNNCGMMTVNNYLCEQTGKLVRIEFLFGQNTHIEKTGVLQSVGKDFMVISETGTNNSIVCSVNNIKFINVYNLNGGMTSGGFGMPMSGM